MSRLIDGKQTAGMFSLWEGDGVWWVEYRDAGGVVARKIATATSESAAREIYERRKTLRLRRTTPERRAEVKRLRAEGMSYKAISCRLHMCERTVGHICRENLS